MPITYAFKFMVECTFDLMTVFMVFFLQKVAECIHQSAKLLEQKNPDAALNALEIISEALSISLYSEKLLKMKGEALIMVRTSLINVTNFKYLVCDLAVVDVCIFLEF